MLRFCLPVLGREDFGFGNHRLLLAHTFNSVPVGDARQENGYRHHKPHTAIGECRATRCLGTKFLEVVCDENGIGDGAEHRFARVAARRALPPGKSREPKRGRGKQLGQGHYYTGAGRVFYLAPL